MLPINISLTGHRNIKYDKKNEYVKKIEQILIDLMNKYKHTKINLLSGMAEGADILGADVVIKLKEKYKFANGESRFGLTAVLPMAKEEFIDTFYEEKKEESKKEFERVLDEADKIIDLSIVNKYMQSEEDKLNNKEITQEEAYIRLGVYLVNHSQRIIAVWSGKNTELDGGTSSVVSYAINGCPNEYKEKYCIAEAHDTKPVYWIEAERSEEEIDLFTNDYNVMCNLNDVKLLSPSIWGKDELKDAKDYYDSILESLDEFNKDVISDSKNKGYEIDECKGKYYKSINGLSEIKETFELADKLALKFQKKTEKILLLMLAVGVSIFVWITFFDDIFNAFFPKCELGATIVILLVPISFVFCVIINWYNNRKQFERKYYDYRALAESLRVQYYWKLALISDNTYDKYSQKNKWELTWIISAIKNICIDANYSICNIGDYKSNYTCIKNHWIRDQLNYFNKNISKDGVYIHEYTGCGQEPVEKEKKQRKGNKQIKFEKHKKTRVVFFSIAFIFVIFTILDFKGAFFESILPVDDCNFHIFMCVIDFCLAVGAFFMALTEKKQMENELRQFKRMAMLMRQSDNKLKELMDGGNDKKDEVIREILISTGKESISENADWVVFNRMSSIDIPMG